MIKIKLVPQENSVMKSLIDQIIKKQDYFFIDLLKQYLKRDVTYDDFKKCELIRNHNGNVIHFKYDSELLGYVITTTEYNISENKVSFEMKFKPA